MALLPCPECGSSISLRPGPGARPAGCPGTRGQIEAPLHLQDGAGPVPLDGGDCPGGRAGPFGLGASTDRYTVQIRDIRQNSRRYPSRAGYLEPALGFFILPLI